MKLAVIASKHAGKDYLSDKLVQYKSYKTIAWADSLKEYCNEIYPGLKKYNTPELKDQPIPEDWNTNNETPREIWERISREKSLEDDRFFHKITLKNIKEILETTDKLVVTDTRNIWEYEDLQEMGFACIRIVRPGKPMFQGYDERIKEFWDDIEMEYINDSDGLDFIRQINVLEEIERCN